MRSVRVVIAGMATLLFPFYRFLILSAVTVIGMAGMLLVMSESRLAAANLEFNIASFGPRTCHFNSSSSPDAITRTGRPFEKSTLEAVRRSFETQALAYGPAISVQNVKRQGATLKCFVWGCDPNYYAIEGDAVKPDLGRRLNWQDEGAAEAVCVVDDRTAKALFGSEDPIGRQLTIGGVPFLVVGCRLNPPSEWGRNRRNGWIHIPFETAQRRLTNSCGVNFIAVSVKPGLSIDGIAAQVHRFLAQACRVQEESIRVVTASDLANQIKSTEERSKKVIYVVGGIAMILCLSTVCILLIFSVRARRQEIALRRALGATKGDVAFEYIGAAVLLCLLGGAIGWVGMLLLQRHLMGGNYFVVNSLHFLGVELLSACLGAVSAILPSLKAAATSPASVLQG